MRELCQLVGQILFWRTFLHRVCWLKGLIVRSRRWLTRGHCDCYRPTPGPPLHFCCTWNSQSLIAARSLCGALMREQIQSGLKCFDHWQEFSLSRRKQATIVMKPVIANQSIYNAKRNVLPNPHLRLFRRSRYRHLSEGPVQWRSNL